MTLLEVESLTVAFGADRSRVTPVESVSMRIAAGEMLGLIGESGCGKSLAGLAILGLIGQMGGRIERGHIRFEGTDLTLLPPRQLRALRGTKIGFVAQNPMTSLNPLVCVGDQVAEIAYCRLSMSGRNARLRALESLRSVGIADPAAVYRQFPHQLSGGLRQRIVIAGALILDPALIIADEPTTALDVSIRAQIVGLLAERARSGRTAVLLITHDLGTVAESCDRVAVMYAGSIVEQGSTAELLGAPRHPYTRALLGCVPRPGLGPDSLRPIAGEVPSPLRFPSGCRFHPRCSERLETCAQQTPRLIELPGHARVACHLYDGEPAT